MPAMELSELMVSISREVGAWNLDEFRTSMFGVMIVHCTLICQAYLATLF